MPCYRQRNNAADYAAADAIIVAMLLLSCFGFSSLLSLADAAAVTPLFSLMLLRRRCRGAIIAARCAPCRCLRSSRACC